MILEYYNKDKLSTLINVDYPNKKVSIVNYTDDLVSRAFGINENPTIKDFEEFLEDRCFPRSRDKLKLILKDIGVDYYDPYLICKKTEGRMAEDNMWIKFSQLLSN